MNFAIIIYFCLIITAVFTAPTENQYDSENQSSSEITPISETQDSGKTTLHTNSYVGSDHALTEVRDDFGQYGLSYVTANGVQVSERGYLKLGREGKYYMAKEGTHKYPNPDGTTRIMKFIADEDGYRVENL